MTTTTSPPSSPPPKSPLAPLDHLDSSTPVQYPRTKSENIQEIAKTPKEEFATMSEQNLEERRIDIMAKRIMAIDKSERDMKALLETLRDTSANLDKTMARLNGSLGKLELKYKVLAKRKADEVGIAKAKR
jgi:small-conductance mechanosensitive channel